jgi:flagellar basal-body rod protein FlgG
MADGSMYISSTGVLAASTYLDMVANNIANLNTTGFKTQQIGFQDLFYTGLQAGAPQDPTSAVGTQVGLGTDVAAINGLFTQGPVTPTGQPFDLAITGEGFFQVELPGGTTGYTRAGNFTPNADGQLVSSDGFILTPTITIPPGTSSVSVGAGGAVTAVTPNGTVSLGQITLTRFVNPDGLERIGNTTFVAGPDTGTATTGAPGTSGLGTITQGSLEGSNVDLPTELVNLILAQRAFQFNTQAIVVESAVLADAATIIPGPIV